MEFDKNSILEELRKGVDAQDLANSFAEAFNSVLKQYQEEEVNRQKQEEKENRVFNAIMELCVVFGEYYPDLGLNPTVLSGVTPHSLVEIYDATYDEINNEMAELEKPLTWGHFPKEEKKEKDNSVKINTRAAKEKSDEELINEFLKSLGW